MNIFNIITPDMPGRVIVPKNGNSVKWLKTKLNQTLSNCAHLYGYVLITCEYMYFLIHDHGIELL